MTGYPLLGEGANAPDAAGVRAGAALRTRGICQAALRLCVERGWAAVAEVPLPNGRRADLFALLPDGSFVIIEVKSGPRDFLSDAKWPEYRAYCDRLYFAVDCDFPDGVLPAAAGLLIADGLTATLVREAPEHRLAPARRRALLHRFAMLAALRLAALSDPAATAAARGATNPE